jgi:hypothetical protein
MTRAWLWLYLQVLLATPALTVAAQESPSRHAPLHGQDGVYGRLDGTLDLGVAAGLELEAGEPRASLRATGHVWWTAGAYLRYADSFGAAEKRARRVLGAGVDVRPLFFPRFGLDYERGPALLDLSLDSLSLSAGAYFAEPHVGELGDERGFELGLGLGLPLLARATGPWLEARAERRFADGADDAWLVTLALSYRALILSTTPRP